MRFFSSLLLLLAVLGLFSCNNNNVIIDKSLQPIFDSSGVNGCFALLENGSNQFQMHNLKRFRDSSFLPGSSFEIVNALVGVESGRIQNERVLIKWDGTVRNNKDWNKDMTVSEAFKASCEPCFQRIARKIGKDTMQAWIDSMSYGTKKIVSRIDTFWLDNSMKIKPDEQLGLIKKLYFNQLPFQKRTQEVVKKIMLQEETPVYKLCYKTGIGYKEDGKAEAWQMGWIEENKHVYFFVLNFETSANRDVAAITKAIFTRIFKEYGFYDGMR